MLDMNVTGLELLTVSITYSTTVGNVEAKVSVIIVPDADHVNTSICPTREFKIKYLVIFKKY